MKILITGGAGFIGSFLTDELIKKGQTVTIFDNLEPQVHQGRIPEYLNQEAEFVQGDLLDYNALKQVVKGQEIIFHQAAMVGVGQSMFQIKRYIEANSLGTANLIDILVNQEHRVKKLLVASSMSIYGEGSYRCQECGIAEPQPRAEERMLNKDRELYCSGCGRNLKPIPTNESKKPELNSIYALTKKDQEQICLIAAKVHKIPTVILRYFNVYGPRQSLSNPYTGVIAIFASRIKNNKPPIIFEDGLQSRDFVSVHDIVRANLLCMESNAADYEIFNVGTGRGTTILQVAEVLSKLYGKDIKPAITHKFRKGDIRHCLADISNIQSKLGFEPKVSLEDGLKEFVRWSETAKSIDNTERAVQELEEKGLL